MHRSSDEYNPDDWDGTDHAEQLDPETWLSNREGQGSMNDLYGPSWNAASRLETTNDYTTDWSRVSRERKTAANYRCSKCQLLLIDRWSELLHTHHINGDKADNHLGNLLVVCIDCHNKLHGFSISDVLPKDRAYLDAMRRQQGIVQ